MFCKDSNSQFRPKLPETNNFLDFKITVPGKVTVQHNLCVHIPCSFETPKFYVLSNDAQGIWIKGNPEQPVKNIVARKNGINDPQYTYPRFFLTGEVWKGDCSLRILDANSEDSGIYTFRLEDRAAHYSFLDVRPTLTVIDLIDTPEISSMQTLVAGERVTLTCTSPGRCAGEAPKITWEGKITRKSTMRQYTIFNEDGTRTYQSNLTFTPSAKDSLERLFCKVTFADKMTSNSETIELQVEACSSMDYKIIVVIIGVNIIILLLIGLGLLFFIKRHMKNAQSGSADLQDRSGHNGKIQSPDSGIQGTESRFRYTRYRVQIQNSRYTVQIQIFKINDTRLANDPSDNSSPYNHMS
ncbi:myeloid cell surface antigen CD33-like [Mantella aurantiaca]